jgi:hypothetical protein
MIQFRYAFWEQVLGAIEKEATTMALVYLDKAGNFGQADNMVLFDTSTLPMSQLKELNNKLDKGESLWSWVFEVNGEGNNIGGVSYVVKESTVIMSPNISNTLRMAAETMFHGIDE